MPTTTITPPAHRLASLIAVECEAVRAHVEARVKMHREIPAVREAYQRAAQVDADAFMALLTAQGDVDNALYSLSYPGGEVTA
jgi:hypothetical protein